MARKRKLSITHPALKGLGRKAKSFCILVVTNPTLTYAECARRAGYGVPRDAAWRNTKNPKVLKALEKLGKEDFMLSGTEAIEEVSRIAIDPEATRSERLKALDMLLKVSGSYAAAKLEVNHTGSVDVDALRAELIGDDENEDE